MYVVGRILLPQPTMFRNYNYLTKNLDQKIRAFVCFGALELKVRVLLLSTERFVAPKVVRQLQNFEGNTAIFPVYGNP